MGEEFNYSLDLIWPAKTESCSSSLTLERAAFHRRIPGRLFSDMNFSFVSFPPQKNILKPLFILDWEPLKWLIPYRKSFFLILMRKFSAWNPERAVANLLLRNSVISRAKECLFEQSLRGLVNSQWHLKAFVDTAVLIWKEWLPINRILKWAVERQRLLGCERSDSHERRLLRVLELTAFHLYLMLLQGWHVQH